MKRKIVMCLLFLSFLVRADNIRTRAITVLNETGKQSTTLETVLNRYLKAVADSKEACLKVGTLVLIGIMTLAENSQFIKGNQKLNIKDHINIFINIVTMVKSQSLVLMGKNFFQIYLNIHSQMCKVFRLFLLSYICLMRMLF